MRNAGKYNRQINIYSVTRTKDSEGFPQVARTPVASPWASVKTTKGMTLIRNNTDFEKAYTNFTFRYRTDINRDMEVDFNGKTYTIEYINNVDEKNVELELQCKEVTH